MLANALSDGHVDTILAMQLSSNGKADEILCMLMMFLFQYASTLNQLSIPGTVTHCNRYFLLSVISCYQVIEF